MTKNKGILLLTFLFAIAVANAQDNTTGNNPVMIEESIILDDNDVPMEYAVDTIMSAAPEDVSPIAEPTPSPAVQEPAAPVKSAQPAATTSEEEETEADFCKHEFAIWGAGGLSTLYYKPTFGDRSGKFGWNAGLGYTYFFSENWGLNIGAEVAVYNAKYEFGILKDVIYNLYDPDPLFPGPFDYYSEINDYKEEQHLMNLNIPISIQFQTNGENKFFATLGGKFGIPITAEYEASADYFRFYGYHYNTNQFLYDQEDMGYGIYSGIKTNKKFSAKYAFIGSVELGMKWKLSERLSLYTGGFFDYCFNDIAKTHTNQFANNNRLWGDGEEIFANTIMTSQYTKDGRETTKQFAKKVSPMAVGLKLRLGITTCKSNKKKEEEEREKDKNNQNQIPQIPSNITVTLKLDSLDRDALKKMLDDLEAQGKIPSRSTAGNNVPQDDPNRVYGEYGNVKGVLVLSLGGYDVDVSRMSPELQFLLNQKVEELRKYGPDATIICEGHTCDLATDSYNMLLGLERAEGVRNHLIANGFKAENVISTSKGERNPMLPNVSEENRRLNRRVVFIIR